MAASSNSSWRTSINAVAWKVQLLTFGTGAHGELGAHRVEDVPRQDAVVVPVPNVNGEAGIAVALGTDHSVCVAGGKLYRWGLLCATEPNSPDKSTPGCIGAGTVCTASVAPSPSPLQEWGCICNRGGDDDGSAETEAEMLDGTVSAVSCGGSNSIMLTRWGEVFLFGSLRCVPRNRAGVRCIWGQSSLTCPTSAKVVSISAGLRHCLLLTEARAVFAIGDDEYGQCAGLGDASSPIPMPSVELISGVSAGACHSAAWDVLGSAYTWGHNGSGRLGARVPQHCRSPAKVDLHDPVCSVGCGGNFTIFVVNAGSSMWGCGGNRYGQLGLGLDVTSSKEVPVLLDLPRDGELVESLSCGTNHSLCLTRPSRRSSGLLSASERLVAWSWGCSSSGQCGRAAGERAGATPTERRSPPEPLVDFLGPSPHWPLAVSAGRSHSAVVARTSMPVCPATPSPPKVPGFLLAASDEAGLPFPFASPRLATLPAEPISSVFPWAGNLKHLQMSPSQEGTMTPSTLKVQSPTFHPGERTNIQVSPLASASTLKVQSPINRRSERPSLQGSHLASVTSANWRNFFDSKGARLAGNKGAGPSSVTLQPPSEPLVNPHSSPVAGNRIPPEPPPASPTLRTFGTSQRVGLNTSASLPTLRAQAFERSSRFAGAVDDFGIISAFCSNLRPQGNAAATTTPSHFNVADVETHGGKKSILNKSAIRDVDKKRNPVVTQPRNARQGMASRTQDGIEDAPPQLEMHPDILGDRLCAGSRSARVFEKELRELGFGSRRVRRPTVATPSTSSSTEKTSSHEGTPKSIRSFLFSPVSANSKCRKRKSKSKKASNLQLPKESRTRKNKEKSSSPDIFAAGPSSALYCRDWPLRPVDLPLNDSWQQPSSMASPGSSHEPRYQADNASFVLGPSGTPKIDTATQTCKLQEESHVKWGTGWPRRTKFGVPGVSPVQPVGSDGEPALRQQISPSLPTGVGRRAIQTTATAPFELGDSSLGNDFAAQPLSPQAFHEESLSLPTGHERRCGPMTTHQPGGSKFRDACASNSGSSKGNVETHSLSLSMPKGNEPHEAISVPTNTQQPGKPKLGDAFASKCGSNVDELEMDSPTLSPPRGYAVRVAELPANSNGQGFQKPNSTPDEQIAGNGRRDGSPTKGSDFCVDSKARHETPTTSSVAADLEMPAETRAPNKTVNINDVTSIGNAADQTRPKLADTTTSRFQGSHAVSQKSSIQSFEFSAATESSGTETAHAGRRTATPTRGSRSDSSKARVVSAMDEPASKHKTVVTEIENVSSESSSSESCENPSPVEVEPKTAMLNDSLHSMVRAVSDCSSSGSESGSNGPTSVTDRTRVSAVQEMSPIVSSSGSSSPQRKRFGSAPSFALDEKVNSSSGSGSELEEEDL